MYFINNFMIIIFILLPYQRYRQIHTDLNLNVNYRLLAGCILISFRLVRFVLFCFVSYVCLYECVCMLNNGAAIDRERELKRLIKVNMLRGRYLVLCMCEIHTISYCELFLFRSLSRALSFSLSYAQTHTHIHTSPAYVICKLLMVFHT